MPPLSQIIKKSPHSPGRVWVKRSRTIDYWSVRLSSKPKVRQFDRVVVCKWLIGVAVQRVACRNEAIRGHCTCHPRAASPRDSEAISWNPHSRGLTRGLCWGGRGSPDHDPPFRAEETPKCVTMATIPLCFLGRRLRLVYVHPSFLDGHTARAGCFYRYFGNPTSLALTPEQTEALLSVHS